MAINKLRFTFLTIMLILCACNQEDSNQCEEIFLNQSFIAQLNDSFCLDDTYEITLKEIADERCPCDAICIWEGELILGIEVKKENEIQNYALHTGIITEAPMPFDLYISHLQFMSIDSCETNVENISFELLIQ